MINVYDFFSGCGGASMGFKQSGMNISLGIDMNKDAANTFRLNFPEADFIEKDIRKIRVEDIASFVKRDSPMLFCGCAPCQPFSQQNKQKSNEDDRIYLLSEFSRFIKYYSPDFIFVENVPGIQKIDIVMSPLNSFLKLLDDLKYNYRYEIIAARDYGVPQPRKRLILLAAKDKKVEFPKSFCDGVKHPYSTVGDWIKGLPKLEAGQVDSHDRDHQAAKLSSLNLRRIKATPEGGSRLDWPDNLKLECHKNYVGHTDVYGRMSYHKMASTLTTKCISYSNGRYGHPDQNRAISLREAACLQTFPRSFKFTGNLNSRASQVGNAVPPLLAKHIGKMFISLCEE